MGHFTIPVSNTHKQRQGLTIEAAQGKIGEEQMKRKSICTFNSIQHIIVATQHEILRDLKSYSRA